MIDKQRILKLLEDMKDSMRPYPMNARTAAISTISDLIDEIGDKHLLKLGNVRAGDFLQLNGKGFFPIGLDCTLYAEFKPNPAENG